MARRLSRRQVAQRRRSRWIITGSLFVLAAAIVVMIGARVAILRTAIDAALAAQGFSDARYNIAMVGLTTTRLTDLQLGPELGAAELSLRYRPLQLTRLQIDEIAMAGLRVDLSALGSSAPGPLARLLAGQSESGDTPNELPILPAIRVGDGILRLPGKTSVSLRDVHLTPGDGATAYELEAKDLELARQDQKLSVSGLKASVTGTTPSHLTIPFSATALRHAVPEPMIAPLAVTGTVTRAETVWRLASTAVAARNTKLTVTGLYDANAGTAEGRIVLPATNFAPGALQPGEIAPPLAALSNVTGTTAGHIGLRWRAGAVTPEGELRFERFGFDAGGVPVEDLSARITMAGDASQPVIRLSETRLSVAGGEFAVDDVALRPLAETNRLVIQVRALDLGLLLEALDVKGVSGQGRLAGRIPLVLSENAVAIEKGKLEAQGSGVLQIASEETAAALAQGGADTNLLLQALADFRYDRLALSLDKPLSGESRLALNTLGHNPAVLDGHPFQINVTVTTDLDKILGVVMTGGRLSQEIIRAIVGANR